MAPPADDMSDDRARARGERAIVVLAIVLMCVGYGLAIEPGTTEHFDHGVFARTIEYQRGGSGFYDAYLEAFGDRDVSIAEARGVRQPLIFLVWRWIPPDLLWPAFLVTMGAVAALMLELTKKPLVVLPVLAYLLTAGRIPSADTIDQWLLVELWALLPLTASVVLLRRGRHGPAAAMAVVAVLIREIAIGYMLVAFVLTWRRDRTDARRWIAGISVAVLGYGAHLLAVQGHLADVGNEAVVLGTGDPPRTVFEMIAWMVPGPTVVGVLVFLVAVWRLATKRTDLWALAGLFALAAAGIFVARPYWGFLFIPFGVFLAAEQMASLIDRRGTVEAAAASSSTANE